MELDGNDNDDVIYKVIHITDIDVRKQFTLYVN